MFMSCNESLRKPYTVSISVVVVFGKWYNRAQKRNSECDRVLVKIWLTFFLIWKYHNENRLEDTNYGKIEENLCRTRSRLPRDPNKQIEIYTRPEHKAIFISSVPAAVAWGRDITFLDTTGHVYKRQAIILRQCFASKELTSLAREKCENRRDFQQQAEPSDLLRVSWAGALHWSSEKRSRHLEM